MTLDLIVMKLDKTSFSLSKISGISPVDYEGVCLLSESGQGILPRYIYVAGPGACGIDLEMGQKYKAALALPGDLAEALPLDRFGGDYLVYDPALRPQEAAEAIAGAMAELRRSDGFKLMLADLLLQGADADAILCCASAALGNPVYVTDPSGRLLLQCGLTQETARKDPVAAELLRGNGVSPALYTQFDLSRLHQDTARTLEPFLRETPGLLPRLVYRVMNRRSYLGRIEALAFCRPFAPSDRDTLTALSDALSLKIRETAKAAFPDGQNLLNGLLEGGISSEESMAAYEADAAGFESRRFYLLVIEPDDAAGWMEEMGSYYLMTARGHLQEWFPLIRHACVFSQRLAALVPEASFAALSGRLEQFLSTYGLFGAVSNRVGNVFAMRAYYRQALGLLSLPRGPGSRQRLRVFHDLYCDLLLGELKKEKQVLEYLLPELQRVWDHDRVHGTDYAQTLYTYLTTDGIQKAAQKLHIHKNTMIYRLEKLREITGADLDDKEEGHKLYLSFLLSGLGRKD